MRLTEVQTTEMRDDAKMRLVKRYIHYYDALIQEANEMGEEARVADGTGGAPIMDMVRKHPADWEDINFNFRGKVYDDLRDKLMTAGSTIGPTSGMYVWKKGSNYHEIRRLLEALRTTMKLIYGEEK